MSSKDDFGDLDEVLDTPETPGKQYDWEKKKDDPTPSKLDRCKPWWSSGLTKIAKSIAQDIEDNFGGDDFGSIDFDDF